MNLKKIVALFFFTISLSLPLYSQSSLTTVILPKCIEGANPTNTNRLPFAYRAKLTGLLSNSTYRFYNQVVISTDAATASGAGNCIFASATGNFIRSTGPSLATTGNYGTFITDGTGAYEGWFITEPTGNKRFVPGYYIFMRITLNDGAGGTTAALLLTTTDSVRVVKLDPAASDSTGTGLRCTSSANPKNFIFAYDDTSNTGRPVSGSFIESDGTDNTTTNSYAAFYANNVNGVSGAFGIVLPNILSKGIRRIEQRSLATGTVVAVATDTDGVWPSGATTVNPSGGTTEILLAGTDLITYSLTVNATNGTVSKTPNFQIYQYGTNVHLTAIPADSSHHFVSWSGDVPSGHETDNPLTVTMNQNRTITASFAINTSAPVVILPTSVSISSFTAILGAKIISNGNGSITERGVVWSTSANPTTTDNKASTSDTNGVYTVTINNLPAGTLIHFRGYAINSIGTGYSSDATFYTLSIEPPANADSLKANAVSAYQINLSWKVAAGATGYIIIQRVGSDPTGLPMDATGYAIGDTIGNGIVAALIISGTTISASVTGLSPATSYHYSILSFAWDGSHPGTYNYKINGTIPMINATTLAGPQLTTVVLPKYIEGANPSNLNRVPFAYRARLTGLLSNTTYRFFNQVVISTDAVTANGAGNCIFASATGNFVRTSGPSLSTAGNYGTFITDGTGTYEGWFITEPTGNKRFVPGYYIFMRIMLNDGAGGTTAALLLTTTDSVRVVKLDPAASDSTGTGLRCTSSANPKNFVFAYDDTSNTGRPISGSLIESDGTDNSIPNSYAAFYANNVNGVNGAFGMVLPNILSKGIRRIEQRSLANGTVLGSATDANGIWPSGVNTVNPSGGTTEIILNGTDVHGTSVQSTVVLPKEFALLQNYPNPFNPSTTISYTLKTSTNVRLSVYDILGREVAVLVNNERKTAGQHEVLFNAANFPSGVYSYKLQTQIYVQTKCMILLK
jgi:Divergent InlB B-repeat domain/Secretion system C-terminal sorting domain